MTAGVITSADGWSYTLTPEDRLWAARMIKGEGGSPVAVLWTMASRLALQRGHSYTSLIRNYSQPVNPRWYRSGDKCGPGGSAVGDEGCEASRLAYRDRLAATGADELGPELATFDRWASGAAPNPVPRAVHFATPEVVAGCLSGRDCTRLIATLGNAHASVARSDTWPASYVRVGGAGDASSFPWGPVVGVGVALVVGAVVVGGAGRS